MVGVKNIKLYVDPVSYTTREIKKHLQGLRGTASKEVIESITKLARNAAIEEKNFVLLQLFFHLPYKNEFEKIMEDPGDFVFIFPSYVSNVEVPLQLFCQVVLKGDLLLHFFQLVLQLQRTFALNDLVDGVMEKFLGEDRDVYQDLYPSVLMMLGKISRNEKDGTFYLDHFSNALSSFLKLKEWSCSKYDWICALIRTFGVCCLQKEDYQASGSDILELLEEWSYDLTYHTAADIKKYLAMLFQDMDEEEFIPIRAEVLGTIEHSLIKLNITQADEEEWKTVHKTKRSTWAEFIGVHSYLTKFVLEKYSSALDQELFNRMHKLVGKWSVYRPKLTKDDFQAEMSDFSEYYKVLKRFGDKDRDRIDLIPRLTSFSYTNVYCTKDGLRAAEKYLVPNGDLKTVTNYILTALDKDKMPEDCKGLVPLPVKLIIQKLFCCNNALKNQKPEVISKIFLNGAHEDLILPDFSHHVNNLCSKIGTIEKSEKDHADLQYEDLVLCTCLQNPTRTIEALLRHSISSQQFRALQFAKPFLKIKCPLQTHDCETSSNLANFCIEKIITSADENDQIFNSLAISVEKLVSLELFNTTQLYEIVHKKITELLINSNSSIMKKVAKLYHVLHSIFKATIGSATHKELLREIFRFATNSKKLTYAVMPDLSTKEMFQIRQTCEKIVEAILTSGFAEPNPLDKLVNEIDTSTLEHLTLVQIGNVYIRLSPARNKIRHFLLNCLTTKKFNSENILNAFVEWVYNSEVEQWSTIIQLITEVLLVDLGTEDILRLYNHSLFFVWESCHSVHFQTTLRQYLKFYGRVVQDILKKGRLNSSGQLLVIESLSCLVKSMHASLKRRKAHLDKSAIDTSIQQVLLLMLEQVGTFISHNKDFEQDLKEEMLDVLQYLPETKGGSDPIRKCILERVQYLDSTNNETGRKDSVNGDTNVLL